MGGGQGGGAPRGHLCDYLPADAWTVLVEPEELHEQLEALEARLGA